MVVKIISPSRETTNKRGETHTLIVAPITNLKDHWYANFYPTSNDDEVELLLYVEKDEEIAISGDIRKYPIGNAYGIVIDIFHAWPLDVLDDENSNNNQIKGEQ